MEESRRGRQVREERSRRCQLRRNRLGQRPRRKQWQSSSVSTLRGKWQEMIKGKDGSSGRQDCSSMKAESQDDDLVFSSVRGKIGCAKRETVAKTTRKSWSCYADENECKLYKLRGNGHADILSGCVSETANSAVSLTFSCQMLSTDGSCF